MPGRAKEGLGEASWRDAKETRGITRKSKGRAPNRDEQRLMAKEGLGIVVRRTAKERHGEEWQRKGMEPNGIGMAQQRDAMLWNGAEKHRKPRAGHRAARSGFAMERERNAMKRDGTE